jgi:uncharacterized protein
VNGAVTWDRVLRWIRQSLGLALIGGSTWVCAQVGNAPASPSGNKQVCPPVAQRPTEAELRQALDQARDRGMLWRISKGGRTSHLFGTIHVGNLAWAPPGPTIRRALADSDILALELDIGDRAILAELQDALTRKPGDPDLPPDLLRGLAEESAAACLPPNLLDGQKPAVRALSLVALSARWEGLDAGYAQEAILADYARETGMPVTSLERVEEQMAALLPTTPEETQRMVRQALTQLKSGVARRGVKRLAEAWAEGRLEELASYETWCECVNTEEDRQMLRRTNDERNPALASRIDRLHSQGQRVFAAVGALHMTGPRALPTLLQQRGYTVERVAYPR